MNLAFAFISVSALVLLSAPMYLLHRVARLRVSDTLTAYIAASMTTSGMVGKLLGAEVTVLGFDLVSSLLLYGMIMFVAIFVKVTYWAAWKQTEPIH